MELSPIPLSRVTQDATDEETNKIRENFFQEIEQYIRSTYGDGVTHPSQLELKSGELAFLGENTIGHNQVTDHRVTYLLYRERVVAAVFATRNGFNNTVHSFFRNLENIIPPEYQ